MPGPESKEEQKKIDATKKTVLAEVKKLGQKTKKQAKKVKELLEEKEQIDKKSKKGPEEKKREKKIGKDLLAVQKICENEAKSANQKINKMLQTAVPADKKILPMWQKGMDRWYIDILNKEPGFDIGGGTRVNGDISFKEKKAVIKFEWKW